MTTLLWFNEDGLNPDHAMLRDYPSAPRIYIFDLPYLQTWHISKQRIQFIYESLLEIPDIQIFKGEAIAILDHLIQQHQATTVVTTETPNHLIRSWQEAIAPQVKLVTYPTHYPVQPTDSPRRFSRYWRKHQNAWLTP